MSCFVEVQGHNSCRNRDHLRQGMQMCGCILLLSLSIWIGICGGSIIVICIKSLSTIRLSTSKRSDDDDLVAGWVVVFLLFGIGMVIGGIYLVIYAMKGYNENGRVINQNPSPAHQPGALAPGGVPQMMQYPPSPGMMPPPGVYGPQPMGTYPHSPTGQPVGYPPSEEPPPYASPGISPPSYDHVGQGAQPYSPPQPSPGVGEWACPPPGGNPNAPGIQATAVLPGMTGDSSNPLGTEYSPPPPYDPDYKSPY